MNKKLVFIHGLGESSQVWEPVINLLPSSWQVITIDVFLDTDFTSGWSLDEVTDRIARLLPDRCHIVGLSLGAVIALNLSIRHPQLVASLFVSAPQMKPPRMLMRLQNIVMRVLPERIVCPPHVTKAHLLQVLDAIAQLDITEDVTHIQQPITIACGTEDWANVKTSRQIALRIPQARLLEVPGAKHQWHTQMPEEFARHLEEHLTKVYADGR